MSKQKKYLSDGHIRLCTFKFDLSKRWYLQYFTEGVRKPFRIWVYGDFKTVADKLKECERLKQILLDGGTIPKRVHTPVVLKSDLRGIDALYKVYNENKHQWRRKTQTTYLSHIRLFEAFLNAENITVINSDSALKYLSYMRGAGKDLNTICNAKRILKRFVSCSNKSKNINPKSFDGIKTPASDRVGRAYFTESQKLQIKDALKNDYQLRLCTLFVYWCAIRPGNELCNLRVKDIDLNLKRIFINSDSAKNKKTESVVIPIQFLSELTNLYLNKYEQNFYVFGKNGVPSAEGYGVGYFSKRFTKVLKDIGFQKNGLRYSLYSFKNTWCVDAYKKGYRIKEIMIHLRHKNIETTDKYLSSLGLFDTEGFNDMGVI